MKSPASSSTSSAAAESSMDNDRRPSPNSTSTEQADGDPAVWAAFSHNFRQVQSVLDRNRALIQQVNENHQSKVHDNLVKNVSLIQEINGNISKVVSMYSDLSSNFTTVCHQRHADCNAARDSGENR